MTVVRKTEEFRQTSPERLVEAVTYSEKPVHQYHNHTGTGTVHDQQIRNLPGIPLRDRLGREFPQRNE